jgi:hypothetical protein
MQLDLSPSEAAVVADILDSALGELREEVYKSEVADYKASLKEREAILTAVLQRLGRRPAGTSA